MREIKRTADTIAEAKSLIAAMELLEFEEVKAYAEGYFETKNGKELCFYFVDTEILAVRNVYCSIPVGGKIYHAKPTEDGCIIVKGWIK